MKGPPTGTPLGRMERLLDGRRSWILIVLVAYVCLTGVFWGAFVGDRGLHAETGFVELSQVRPVMDGFIYPYDRDRPLMAVGFHLGYLLTKNSYLGLHIVLGIFILLTGLLSYLIVARLTDGAVLFAFVVGALTISCGADYGANWVGYVVQRQTTVFGLLAVLLFLEAWRSNRLWWFPFVLLGQALSLWTYEAILPLLAAAPLLLYRKHNWGRRFVVFAAVWSIVPVTKAAGIAYRYLLLQEVSYQSRILSSAVSPLGLVENLATLMVHGLAFWRWPAADLATASDCGANILGMIAGPTLIGAVCFVGAAVAMRRLPPQGETFVARRWLLLGGLAGMCLAYLAFLPLPYPGSQRTQLISALPASLVLAAIAFEIGRLVRSSFVVPIVLTCLVVTTGLATGLLGQIRLARDWAPYRKIMGSIVTAAPRVRDGTLILLVGVPSHWSRTLCQTEGAFDPFRDVMWFNSGLQVLYEDTKLVGLYYRDDGTTSESIRFEFSPDGARFRESGLGVEDTEFDYSEMIAFRFDDKDGAVLLKRFPIDSVLGATQADGYAPENRILNQPVPEAVRSRLQLP
ncbi:MAG: hypothetical protein WD733_19070 [Bryobacterales bacterium]